MRQLFAGVFTLATLFLYSQSAIADPWFTGPILAPAGRTIPNGHTNLETYGFYTLATGFYNNIGHWVHTPTQNSSTLNPVFTHGITDSLDVQFSIPYVYNRNHGFNSHKVGDTAVALGYQLIEQKHSKWRPNLRVTVQQVIPTGVFRELSPASNGTDASGLGSYQTAFALNFQHLAQLSLTHYFRSRLILTYVSASATDILGFSVYGGTSMTYGNIKPGDMWSADLAGEFTLTQNIVAVMETYIARRQATNFKGFVGTNPDGSEGMVGHGVINQYTLAPAIEYNFTSNIGMIAGPWFTVAGKNSTRFISYVVALNAYW